MQMATPQEPQMVFTALQRVAVAEQVPLVVRAARATVMVGAVRVEQVAALAPPVVMEL
jgi:hypothetical protein